MPIGTIQDSRNPNSPQWGYLEVTLKGSESSNPGQWPKIYDPDDWNKFVMFMHNKQKPGGGGTETWPRGTGVEFEFLKAKISVHKNDNPGNPHLPNSLNRNIWVAVLVKKTP